MDSRTTVSENRELSTDLSRLARLLQHRRALLIERNPRLAPWFLDLTLPKNPDQTVPIQSLPFLSIRAFKHELVSTVDPEQPGSRTFFSSGSTGSRRGQHVLGEQALASYAAASHKAFQNALSSRGLPIDTPVFSLVPPPSDWSDSSLAAMIAMWQARGQSVRYVSPDELYREFSKERFLGEESLVIFGTTAHHLLVRQKAQMGADRVMSRTHRTQEMGAASAKTMALIFDTGGTKGRTDTPSIAEQSDVLRNIYTNLLGPNVDVEIASEYGMSELCSQAWSQPGKSLREFSCANGLRVATVSPELDRLCVLGSYGFLAFVDERNTDSYPAIITEDCGWSHPGTVPDADRQNQHWLTPAFTLEGRAPLASAKGCSLRVFGQVPQPIDSEHKSHVSLHSSATRSQDQTNQLPDFPAVLFTPQEQKELRSAWESAYHAFNLYSRDSHSGKNLRRPTTGSELAIQTSRRTLEIVASANICVTFLYPLCAAAITKYTHARIFLPSNRDDDPLASHVRAQIDWVIRELQSVLPLEIEVFPSSAGLFARRHVDTALVFGTDETVSLFRNFYKKTKARFIGFGQVLNCAVLPNLTPEAGAHAAETCMVWKGRGCLTPAVIYVPDGDPQSIARCMDAFCVGFASAFRREHLGFTKFCTWFHRHDLIAIRAAIKSHLKDLPSDAQCLEAEHLVKRAVVSGAGWAVVNLLEIPRSEELAKRIELEWTGQGLVFLAPISCRKAEGWPSVEMNSRPTFANPHFGKTWINWLSEAEHS